MNPNYLDFEQPLADLESKIAELRQAGAGSSLDLDNEVKRMSVKLRQKTEEIFANLNALFLMAVGTGYAMPWRDPERYRGYLWVMGPGLKGAGAVTFVLDYLLRDSPRSFLLFAASDGALALLTLVALLTARPPRAA